MKKIVLLLIIFTCFAKLSFAQTSAKTENCQFISIGLIGASYGYEYAFADKFTIIGSVGLNGIVGYRNDNFFDEYNGWYYSFHPFVSVEPRFYYNINKRAMNGKSTYANKGPFIAVQCSYLFKPIIKHKNYDEYSGFGVSPYWGYRWVLGQRFLLEGSAGLSFGWNNYNDSNVGVYLGLKFSYKL